MTIKAPEQQDLAMLMKLRDGFIVQRTRTINQLHGFAHEYGVCLPTRSRARLCEKLVQALDDGENSLSSAAREVLRDLWADVLRLDERIAALLLRAQTLASSAEASAFVRLQTLPGVGPVVATILLGAVGSGVQFRSGRQLAAWAGLVPRQHGSGGKTQLLGITKNGYRQLRTMLIHGARAVVTWIDRRNDALGDWVKGASSPWAQSSGGPYTVRKVVIASGVQANGAPYSATLTATQAVAGVSNGAPYQLCAGFHPISVGTGAGDRMFRNGFDSNVCR